tara:strand:- start:2008 stop:2355 length:348 start_codon:yes stop_codon:yes gene_type:complete
MEVFGSKESSKKIISLLVYQYIGLLVSNFTMVENEGLFIFGSYNNGWFTESLYLLVLTGIAAFYLLHFWALGRFIDFFINYKYNFKKYHIEFDMLLPISVIFISVIYYPKYAYAF